jgi:hypothetical protein
VVAIKTWYRRRYCNWIVDVGYPVIQMSVTFDHSLRKLSKSRPVSSGTAKGVRDLQYRVRGRNAAVDLAVQMAEQLLFEDSRPTLETARVVARGVHGIYYVNIYLEPGKGYRHLKKWMEAAYENVGTTGGER